MVVFWNILTVSGATIRFLAQKKLSPDRGLNPGIYEYIKKKFGRVNRFIRNVLNNAEFCTCDTHMRGY